MLTMFWLADWSEKIEMINKHNGMVVYLIAYQYANIN